MDGFDLGTHSRRVSTRSPEAQRWFDIGLNWCYGFNHEEGIRCFEKALGFDPGGAMAHWGIAYASGPFYNLTWQEHGAAEAGKATRRCFEHVQLAKEAAGGASPVERRLIEALAARFQKPHALTAAEFEHWDDAYAAEMRRVHFEFPLDPSPRPGAGLRGRAGLPRRPRAERYGSAVHPAPGQRLGAARPGGVPGTARRDGGAARSTRQTPRSPREDRCAHQFVLPVQDEHAAGRRVLSLSKDADSLAIAPPRNLYRSYPKLGEAGRHQLRDLIDHAATDRR